MGRYLSILSGGRTLQFKTGSTVTFDSGSTLVMDGTLTLAAVNLTAAGNFATTGTLTAGSTLTVTTTSHLIGNVTMDGSLTIGAGLGTIVDGAGNDLTLTETNITLVGIVTHTGATVLTGVLGVTGLSTLDSGGATPSLKLNSAGDKSAVAWAAVGTHVGDGGTFAFVPDQMYMRVYVGATIYNIPLWADA
jgi:hypothetical protein